jgi:HEPN domain-containing protein/predicted nucleotidyltransferase
MLAQLSGWRYSHSMIDSVNDTDPMLRALANAVVERFAPERILLFGSRARGDHRPDSDYDLIVVLEDGSHPADAVVRAIHDIEANVDVIVDTCDRFERRRNDVGTLEYAADREGRMLYTRPTLPRQRRQVREMPNSPPGSPPESVNEWLARAESDFTAMSELAKCDTANLHDVIVFHAHQGVEKLLKASLVSRNIQPPRTHNLVNLLQWQAASLRGDPDLREACAGLHALWPGSRYPHEPVPTAAQVGRAIAWAEHVRNVVSLSVRPSH